MNPVILIGLGGIGSKIVDEVCEMLPKGAFNVAAAALDTDVNDLSSLKNIKTKIQTAPRVRIGSYLANSPEVMEWFPHNYHSIKEKMMTDGAGQIRSVSRLALYSAIQNRKLNKLNEMIESIFNLKDESFVRNAKVVIVGSINGGTAAGSFIQIGTYLRDYFREINPNASVKISGVFMLPDILIKTGKIKEQEFERLRANAYASLKELNALLSPTILDNITINLEYRPNQEKISMTHSNRPYDMVMFFDYENDKNHHLPSFEAYTNQIINSIYHGFISPISTKHYSIIDNLIINNIQKSGEAFYSGASTAKLIYPYADIVDFINYEWINEEIDEVWGKIDRVYKEAFEDYERDIQKGIDRVPPNRAKLYLAEVDRVKSDDEPDSFINEIYRQTKIYDESGRVLSDKAEEFIISLEEHIEKTLSSDSDFKKHQSACQYSEYNLKKEESAQIEIEDMEFAAKNFLNAIDEIVNRYKRSLSNDIILKGCNKEQNAKYAISYWLSELEAMHPSTIRYFLYKTKLNLEKKLDEYKSYNKQRLQSIKKYEYAYDLVESEDFIESAIDRISDIISQDTFTKIKKFITFQNDFTKFIELYKDTFVRYTRNLAKYTRGKLLETSLEIIIGYITDMIEDWERFFELLTKEIRNDILISRNKILNKHTNSETNIYLFEKPKEKFALWRDCRLFLVGESVSDDISKEIFKKQYLYFCQKTNNPKQKRTTKEEYQNILVDAFRDLTLQKINTKIDLDIYDAIIKLQNLSDEEISLKDFIQKLKNKNLPWSRVENLENLTKLWGINSTVAKDSTTKELEALIEGNIIENGDFSKYEIVYFCANHNMLITEFPKFAISKTGIDEKTKGVYFRAYNNIIERLNKNPLNEITPHLDKRWHNPKFLPDLNKEFAQKIVKDINRAFVLGITYKWLNLSSLEGESMFMYFGVTRSQKVTVGGYEIKTNRWLDLYDALYNNPTIVDEILSRHTKEIANLNYENIENSKFIKGLSSSNILDKLFYLSQKEATTEDEREKAYDSIKILKDEIENFNRQIFGQLRENLATKLTQNLIDKLWSEAKIKNEEREDSVLLQNWKSRFLD